MKFMVATKPQTSRIQCGFSFFSPKLPQLKQLTGRAVKPFMVLPFYFNDKVFYEPVSCVMVNV